MAARFHHRADWAGAAGVLAACAFCGAGLALDGPAAAGAGVTGLGPRTAAVNRADYSLIRHVSYRTGSDTAGDGSEIHPWATLRHALSRMTEARRGAVLVAEGVYRERALRLREGVDLYGGFSSANWSRDVELRPSTLDGEGRDRVLIGANRARVDGFTIRGGRSKGPGGAVLCDRTSPVLSNNVFTDNGTLVPEGYLVGVLHQVGSDGGAVACVNYAAPVIENCLFVANTTEMGGGGAIGMRSQSVRPREETPCPTVRNSIFVHNRTGMADTDPNIKKRARSSNGGAISLSNFHAQIENNLFVRNSVGGNSDAGAIYCEYESSPVIERNTFVGNSAEDDGGALYSMKLSEPRIVANVFAGNTGGGTIRLSKYGRARIEGNYLFANPGGGVNCGNSWMLLAGNVIAENQGFGVSQSMGATAYLKPGMLRGNIIWGNAARGDQKGQVEVDRSEPPLVEDNTIQGGFPGKGNRDEDPGLDTTRVTVPLTGITFDDATGRSTLRAAGPLPAGPSVRGRAVRAGDRWGVVQSTRERELIAWGDLRAAERSSPQAEILGTYLPRRGAAAQAAR